ncbi:MAG: pyruvate kinase [Acidobacteriota bacterium]
MRRAKIVCTIGPATDSRQKLRELIEAGMDVARLNFSHGEHQTHATVIRHIRELCVELGKPVALLQDLQGLKIRTGNLAGGVPVQLTKGRRFLITTESIDGNQERVSTSYRDLPKDIKAGDRILVSDGLIELKVLETTDTEVRCEIVSGGMLAQRQGINIPGAMISAPALTAKDLDDLQFGIEQQVDYIALSFVRRAEDVLDLKEKLSEKRLDIPIIAKLEKPRAIDNLSRIMDVCEGVMVARGDLGVEITPEKVPVIQKHIIREANRKGKLVITATQMLESMINNPRPTRAEASDVANAVFDGTDALMLSGETAKGSYPVESVQMMVKIIHEAEKDGVHCQVRAVSSADVLSFPEAVCDAAYHASTSIRARAIVAFTQTGSTAKMISKYRPPSDILAFTPHDRIVSRMCLYWGVIPMRLHEITNVDELICTLDDVLMERQIVKENDNLIIITGAPIMEKGHTSLMKLHSVRKAP